MIAGTQIRASSLAIVIGCGAPALPLPRCYVLYCGGDAQGSVALRLSEAIDGMGGSGRIWDAAPSFPRIIKCSLFGDVLSVL